MTTQEELKAWARGHLLAARITRKACPQFQPMVAIHRAGRDMIGVLASVPKAKTADVLWRLARRAKATAIALVVDSWMALPMEGSAIGEMRARKLRVRDMPGRTDALVVMGMLADGRTAMWFARYWQDAQARVTLMDEPEYGGESVVTHLLPDPWAAA